MFFFFKRKFRHGFSGRCGHHGAGMTPEQRAQRREWIVNRVSNKLALNAEQKPLLAALLEQMGGMRQAMTGQTTDLRAEARSWMAGATLDAERLQALINDKAQTLQTTSPAAVAALAAFYDSLNPAQQQKVRDRLEGRRGWFCRRHA
jgi:protein CpxP